MQQDHATSADGMRPDFDNSACGMDDVGTAAASLGMASPRPFPTPYLQVEGRFIGHNDVAWPCFPR